jgi:hypothetical protein
MGAWTTDLIWAVCWKQTEGGRGGSTGNSFSIRVEF